MKPSSTLKRETGNIKEVFRNCLLKEEDFLLQSSCLYTKSDMDFMADTWVNILDYEKNPLHCGTTQYKEPGPLIA